MSMPVRRLAGSECRQVAGDERIELFHQPESEAVIGFHQQQQLVAAHGKDCARRNTVSRCNALGRLFNQR